MDPATRYRIAYTASDSISDVWIGWIEPYPQLMDLVSDTLRANRESMWTNQEGGEGTEIVLALCKHG